MSKPSAFGYYAVPTLGEAIEEITGACWWLWLVLFALASLLSIWTSKPNAMAVAVVTLAFALLSNYTAPAREGGGR